MGESIVDVSSERVFPVRISLQTPDPSHCGVTQAMLFLFQYRKRHASQKLRTRLLAAVVFGSGLVNLLSVAGPPLQERYRILRGIFPLEFLHLSRFITLLSGLVLVITSINALFKWY